MYPPLLCMQHLTNSSLNCSVFIGDNFRNLCCLSFQSSKFVNFAFWFSCRWCLSMYLIFYNNSKQDLLQLPLQISRRHLTSSSQVVIRHDGGNCQIGKYTFNCDADIYILLGQPTAVWILCPPPMMKSLHEAILCWSFSWKLKYSNL